MFFSKNIRKFATSPSPILGCYWLYKKLPANRSDCTLALRSELLQRCRRGRGCSELWKNTIFPEHPVPDGSTILLDAVPYIPNPCSSCVEAVTIWLYNQMMWEMLYLMSLVLWQLCLMVWQLLLKHLLRCSWSCTWNCNSFFTHEQWRTEKLKKKNKLLL